MQELMKALVQYSIVNDVFYNSVAKVELVFYVLAVHALIHNRVCSDNYLRFCVFP